MEGTCLNEVNILLSYDATIMVTHWQNAQNAKHTLPSYNATKHRLTDKMHGMLNIQRADSPAHMDVCFIDQ